MVVTLINRMMTSPLDTPAQLGPRAELEAHRSEKSRYSQNNIVPPIQRISRYFQALLAPGMCPSMAMAAQHGACPHNLCPSVVHVLIACAEPVIHISGCFAGDQCFAIKQPEAHEAAGATCRTAPGSCTAGGRPAFRGRHQAATHVGGRACCAAGFGACTRPGAAADVMQM